MQFQLHLIFTLTEIIPESSFVCDSNKAWKMDYLDDKKLIRKKSNECWGFIEILENNKRRL
jgi:hypothetical protein